MRHLPALLLAALFSASPALAEEARHDASVPLTTTDRVAIETALDARHKAIATWAKVLLDHPDAKPFAAALEAEKQHAAVLSGLLESNGQDVPASRWAGRVRGIPDLVDACRAGIQAVSDDAKLYTDLAGRTDRQDLRDAFADLKAASAAPLEDFEKCVEKAEKKAAKGKN